MSELLNTMKDVVTNPEHATLFARIAVDVALVATFVERRHPNLAFGVKAIGAAAAGAALTQRFIEPACHQTEMDSVAKHATGW